MPKIIFTAIDPNGVEHKRTSDRRSYSHTVVYQKAVHEARAKARHASHIDNGRYYLQCIAKGFHESLMKFEHYASDQGRHDADVKMAYAELKGCTTAEGFAAMRVAEELLKLDAEDWSAYWNAGWCGRFDLAQKLAAACGGLNVAILPAVVKS